MNKKDALKILIENSYVLNEESKAKFLMGIDTFTEEEIIEFGKLFSQEQDFVENNKEEIFVKTGDI